MRSKILSLMPLMALLLGIAAMSVIFLYTTPEAFVRYIGIQNGYAFMAILAFLSGVSLFTGAPYILMMITLASGGLNPLGLALAATIGDSIGSTLAYTLGRLSGEMADHGTVRWIQHRLLHIAHQYPRLLPAAIFAYGCAAPFSNDVVTIPMGIIRYPYLKTMIPLQIGTFVYNFVIAFGGLYIYSYLAG